MIMCHADSHWKEPLLIKKARETIDLYAMLKPGDAVLAAISGGPDSVALLLLLRELSLDFSLTIGVSHLNHTLRGKESDRDEEFVFNLAAKFNLPCHIRRSDVSAFAEKNRLSLEEAARDVRYGFYNELADEKKYTKIALGHNYDDNAELVLMNLLRGSGTKGIAGIPPVRGRRIIRPLIRVSREDILDYLTLRNQDYVVDSSNSDTVFLRNRVRNDLLPLLKKHYNPGVADALNRLSSIVMLEEEWMAKETKAVFIRAILHRTKSDVHLDKEVFKGLHPALSRRVLRHAIRSVKKDLRRITLAHIDDVLNLILTGTNGKSLDLPDRIRTFIHNGKICFKHENLPLRQIGKKNRKG